MPSDLIFPTGLKMLDRMLGGGMPVAGNLLLYGEPLCGKRPLMMQFVYEGLKMNIPGIFVLTDFGFAEWKAMMEASGWKLAAFEKNGMLQVIDCYSRQFDPALVDEGIVAYVDSPSDLSSISLQLSGLQEQIVQVADHHRLGLHSISSLLETNSPESVFRFLQFITGKFRRSGASALYSLEKGMHDEKYVHMVEHLMDGVLEFSEDKIHVRGIVGASDFWHNYEIAADGIKIKV